MSISLDGMPWFTIPAFLFLIGIVGLFLLIRSYNKGETVSLKKLLVAVMFTLGPIGIVLQKFDIIHVAQFEQLLSSFDRGTPEEESRQRKEKVDSIMNDAKEAIKSAHKK